MRGARRLRKAIAGYKMFLSQAGAYAEAVSKRTEIQGKRRARATGQRNT